MSKFIEVTVFTNKNRTVSHKELINIDCVFRIVPIDEYECTVYFATPSDTNHAILVVAHNYDEMINLVEGKN